LVWNIYSKTEVRLKSNASFHSTLRISWSQAGSNDRRLSGSGLIVFGQLTAGSFWNKTEVKANRGTKGNALSGC
jgi:hypothetical protein